VTTSSGRIFATIFPGWLEDKRGLMPGRILSALFITLLIVALTVPVAAVLPPGGTFIDDDRNLHEGSIEAIAARGINGRL
jgi:hypothetical protein